MDSIVISGFTHCPPPEKNKKLSYHKGTARALIAQWTTTGREIISLEKAAYTT